MSTPIRIFVLAALLLLVAAMLLAPLPNQYRASWVHRSLDLGHLPLFAGLTLALWRWFGRSLWRAWLLSSLVAVAMEALQWPTDRSASWFDAATGVLGGLIAVILIQAFRRPRSWRRVAVGVAAAVALAAIPVAVTAPVLIDAYRARRDFPVVCGFQSPWERARWRSSTVGIKHVPAALPGGRPAGRMRFPACPGGYRDVVLFPVVGDWTGYARVCCDFRVEEGPIRLTWAVRDGKKISPRERRFRLDGTYEAGEHQVCLDLASLAAGEEFAPVDVSRIQSFHIIARGLEKPQTVAVERVYLE